MAPRPNCSNPYSLVYTFVDRAAEFDAPSKVFYVGSSNDVLERLKVHIEDMMVNDTTRDTYDHVHNHVGVDQWDVYVLEDNIPRSRQWLTEREYYDMALLEFELKNCNKPPMTGSSGGEAAADNRQVSTLQRSTCAAQFEGLKARIRNHEMTTTEALLNEVKRQLLNARKWKGENELVQKNKLLMAKNKELRVSVEKMGEHAKVQDGHIATLEQSNVDLRAHITDLKDTCTDLKDHVMSLKQSCVDQKAHNNKLKVTDANITHDDYNHRLGDDNNMQQNGGTKRCDMCNKVFSASNISRHYKICAKKHMSLSRDQLITRINELQQVA